MNLKAASTTTWTNPWLGALLALFSTIGVFCSYGLLHSELKVLNNPDAVLGCDINPLIGCSDSLMSPQAHLFGIPNSAVGFFVFGMLLALAAVLIFRGSLPRPIWWGMTVGVVLGLAYVIYFLVHSVATFHSLCPYCMGIWAAVLGALPLVIGGAFSSGSFGNAREQVGASLLKYSWAIILGLYLLVVLVIVVTMSDKVALLF